MAIIQSIERGMLLLELLAEGDNFSLTELSHRANLKAPTCRNILSTLISLGYVSQHTQSRHYFITGKAVFGHDQHLESSLTRQSLLILQNLVHRCSETIVLCRYRNAHRRTLLALEPQQALRVTAKEGEDSLFFTTATGRMLLSQLPNDEVEKLLKKHKKWGEQWPEAAGSSSLQNFLLEIRQSGFLVFNRSDSIQALAVPVNFPKENLYAALGMYYPSVRNGAEKQPYLIEQLQKAAAAISSISLS